MLTTRGWILELSNSVILLGGIVIRRRMCMQSIHAFFLCFVFGWVAVPLAYIHLIIDCRWPVEKWSKFIGQTQPTGVTTDLWTRIGRKGSSVRPIPVVDIGLEVRFWNDQVFHIICIAIAALIVGSV
jgi:hypothetical protein